MRASPVDGAYTRGSGGSVDRAGMRSGTPAIDASAFRGGEPKALVRRTQWRRREAAAPRGWAGGNQLISHASRPRCTHGAGLYLPARSSCAKRAISGRSR